MKSEGESSLSGTLKQKHQSAVETNTTAGEESTHTYIQAGKHLQGEDRNIESTYWDTGLEECK